MTDPEILWALSAAAVEASNLTEMFPGVWPDGDWNETTDRGAAIIYGRSGSTINRGGIRIDTAEIYRAVLESEEATDALVVDLVVEVPVKRILMGADAAKVVSRDSLANPEALDWFVALTRTAATTVRIHRGAATPPSPPRGFPSPHGSARGAAENRAR